MKIKNVDDYEARHPWPQDLFIQGGRSGLVINLKGGANYGTTFVECFPEGTFVRGEGPTIEAAEDDCWEKYQKVLHCPGGGEHGPYEPRGYDNGSGFCVKCGVWFNGVLEPSMKYLIDALAGAQVKAHYGEEIVLMPQWKGLVADEAVKIWAQILDKPVPEPTTEPPTTEEIAARRMDPDRFYSALEDLLAKLGEEPK